MMDAITKAAIEHVATLGSLSMSSEARVLRDAIEAKHPGAIARTRIRNQQRRFDAKFAGNPPPWVKRMVAKHAPSLDALRWHRSRVGSFHGTCYGYGEVSMTVPAKMTPQQEQDAKVLVLHELAHHKRPSAQHGDRFYDEFYRLLVAERLYRYAIGRPSGTIHSIRRAARRARAAA